MRDIVALRIEVLAAAAAARERWTIAMTADELADSLVARLEGSAVPSGLQLVDLCLASACACGDTGALGAFDAKILGDLPGMLAHLGATPGLIEETRSMLREKLFTGKRPRILDYAGTAELHSWVRVVASRVAIDLLRREGRELALGDDRFAELAADADDPELAYFKASYRSALAAAFAGAVVTLSSKQRNLLRFQILDQLTVDQIGGIYGVHRATAARWVERAREVLVTRTRKILIAQLRVDGVELDSIMRLVRSRMDLSLSRLLRSG